WVARINLGKVGSSTRYKLITLGKADDDIKSDVHTDLLSYGKATTLAREKLEVHGKNKAGPSSEPLTVRKACEEYVTWLKTENSNTGRDTEIRLRYHVLLEDRNALPRLDAKDKPKLADKLVNELTFRDLDQWKLSMVRKD